MKLISDTQIAYMAGIFDGEGWVGINTCKPYGAHKTPRYSLYIGVSNTYLPVLDMFVECFSGRIKNTNSTNKPCYCWRTTSHKAAYVLETFMPYLTVKKEQAKIAIEYVNKHCNSFRSKLLTQEELNDRELFKTRIVAAR
jgi:hypothetical protein